MHYGGLLFCLLCCWVIVMLIVVNVWIIRMTDVRRERRDEDGHYAGVRRETLLNGVSRDIVLSHYHHRHCSSCVNSIAANNLRVACPVPARWHLPHWGCECEMIGRRGGVRMSGLFKSRWGTAVRILHLHGPELAVSCKFQKIYRPILYQLCGR